jgi:hypothetical protein
VSYDRGLAVGMYLHDVVNIVVMDDWKKRPDEDVARQLAAQ